jgi:hypothetical protein
LLVVKKVDDKLHYLAPPATLSVVLIAIAISLEQGWSQATTKTIFCALAVLLMNPVLTQRQRERLGILFSHQLQSLSK